jgi:hypothetical protein
MKGGDPSQRMLGNVLRILEFEFPASYKKASSESTRWFDWKRQLAWSGL